jgi:hypothetical protein
MEYRTWRYIYTKPEFVNFYGVRESIPRNRFRQPIYPSRRNRFLGSLIDYIFGLWCETILKPRGGPDPKMEKCSLFFSRYSFRAVSCMFGFRVCNQFKKCCILNVRVSKNADFVADLGTIEKVQRILRLYFENVHIILYESMYSIHLYQKWKKYPVSNNCCRSRNL